MSSTASSAHTRHDAPVPVPDRAPRDRTNPSIADVIRLDPTQPISAEVRELVARDLARWSHRALLPIVRVVSLVAIALIRFAKAIVPDVVERRLRWHRGIDVLCMWFTRRFMSADAAALLARHFVVETNLLAFIAQNAAAPGEIVEPTLRPRTLADLGNHAVIDHDVNVYNLVIDVGVTGADVHTRRAALDFSALHVPTFDAERERNRIVELDIETALYLMNIPFCLFTTQAEYARAVNSFQLDESVCAMLAGITGDATFRTWTPLKFPSYVSVNRDVPKELYFHACVCEYAHTYLERIRDGAVVRRGGARHG